jgi:uncharacterized membrane protein
MMQSLLVPLVLALIGLAAGVLVGTQLGGYPLLAALPPERYVHAHAFFASRYDPFMPACLLGTLAGDALLAAVTDGPAVRGLFAVGAALALATVLISVTKNVPINKAVKALDPDRLPADFARQDRRREWGRWNQVRGGLAVAALAANCLAVALLI